MRIIDQLTWPRRKHFQLFRTFDHPHFNMCANVDMTTISPIVKELDISITIVITYVLSRVANLVPEFRYRIRGEEVIEHDRVHPAVTILVSDDLFSFCSIEYSENFTEFAVRAAEKISYVKEHPTLENEDGLDHWLFMTAIPWVSFTSFTHPMQLHPADSVPRFAWGKFFSEGERLKMPLSVQGHHALMDGLHMGRYYSVVQEYLHHPEFFLGKT